MPSKKKKYNARFPAGRIKKIMQTDEEVGKVAQAVPVIISRTLELFVESLLTKTLKITNARNAKTLSPSHMKQCIISESRFDFLRDLVKNIPDMGINEELSGSEAGYGNDGASPASTSTSSSSNGGGGGGGTASALSYESQQQSHHHHRLGGGTGSHSGTLQRSESYSPATASSASPYATAPKRGLSQGGILNFYKEIPLEEEESDSSPPPPPPPKLTRLNSAPAATAIPYKIDILATGTGGTEADKHHSAASATPIGYKIEPVIKLDYSNLVSLSSGAATVEATSSSSSSNVVPTGSSTKAASAPQPTVKIDLSRLPMATAAASTQATTIATPKQLQHHQPVPSTIATRTTERRERQPPATGGGSNSSSQQPPAASGSSASSSSSSSPQSAPTTPIIGQSPVVVPTAPPIFAALSSAIPGMDEDYDDI
uniref:Putative class 2 transcription repressor nc2 alpha subunit drap1 n=1 Tax=Anopheles triannulatus TaxID=58253 RepID=A0A2M4AU28_9DIPT